MRIPTQKLIEYLPYLAFAQALVAMLGSLYFSEIMDLPPCKLCWFERIAMYPLVPILIVGILKKDRDVGLYTLPLVIFGFIIAIYHNLLYWKILPESYAPCQLGVSCTTKFFEWFGFITIPLMALTAFVILGAVLGVYHYLTRKYDQ